MIYYSEKALEERNVNKTFLKDKLFSENLNFCMSK